MAETIRAFIAIPLPDAVRERIAGLQRELRRSALNIRWVPPGNIHLTLKFLGAIDARQIDAVAERMAAVAGMQAPFSLALSGVGVFPDIRRARVLWVGAAGDAERLLAVQAALETALETLGMAREKRRFRAHLTIGRPRQPVDGRRLAQVLGGLDTVQSLPFRVSQLRLYKSDLNPGGAVYTCLHTAHLVD